MIGPILCAVLSIYDGDTLTVECEIWPTFTVSTKVRINGIDTPEIRTRCLSEKARGYDARNRLIEMNNGQVVLKNVFLGKFAGRVIADVYIDGKSVAQVMIDEGFAREYHGGKRKVWCDD